MNYPTRRELEETVKRARFKRNISLTWFLLVVASTFVPDKRLDVSIAIALISLGLLWWVTES